MLDFRPRVQPTNYLSRREQRRLLAWVMGIGLIVIAVAAFAKIGRFASDRLAPTGERSSPVDTRFQPGPRESGEPDAVSILPAEQPLEQSDADELLPGVSTELLARVRDDTPWIRSAEIDAWLNVWNALSQSQDDEIASRSTSPVGFLELFQQPRAFRGQLVTIRGSARQALYVDAAENEQGIDGYYRVIIRPDRGPPEPVFLYTLELPAGFPVGERIRAEIEATGVFFKRMVYPAGDTAELRRAPVVMARTLAWQPPTLSPDSATGWIVGTLVTCVALGAVALLAVTYWASPMRIARVERRPETLPPVDDRSVESVEQSLRRLAENDQ
jgi:hypothetical protein